MFNKRKILAILGLALIAGLTACGDTNIEAQNDNGNYTQIIIDETPETPDWGNYQVIINGVGVDISSFTLDGETSPTHVSFLIIWELGLDAISAGSQHAIQRNGEFIAALSTVNYLAFNGGDTIDMSNVGINSTFMADDFNTYIPISFLKELDFIEIYVSNGHVFINN